MEATTATDQAIEKNYLPSPEEIAAACREIQAEWTESERRRRAGLADGSPSWRAPTVKVWGADE